MKDAKLRAAQGPAPRRDSGRSTRERLLKAAFAVFCERGFHRASMLENQISAVLGNKSWAPTG
jgi:AcrR family transcriptional regulator